MACAMIGDPLVSFHFRPNCNESGERLIGIFSSKTVEKSFHCAKRLQNAVIGVTKVILGWFDGGFVVYSSRSPFRQKS
jgi:hypothetical protein